MEEKENVSCLPRISLTDDAIFTVFYRTSISLASTWAFLEEGIEVLVSETDNSSWRLMLSISTHLGGRVPLFSRLLYSESFDWLICNSFIWLDHNCIVSILVSWHDWLTHPHLPSLLSPLSFLPFLRWHNWLRECLMIVICNSTLSLTITVLRVVWSTLVQMILWVV